MPRMGDETNEEQYAKLLLIGDGKCGKTHLAAKAAEAGFNVLYFDGDVGRQTIKSMGVSHDGKPPALSKDALNRIYLMAVGDSIDAGQRTPRMWEIWKEFYSTTIFRWNDTRGELSSRAKDKPGDVIWDIKPARMNGDTLLVLDSWTSLTESISLAAGIANSVDISEAVAKEMRPVYQAAGLKATEALRIIRSLKCHVIVIAHPDEFSHTVKPDGRKVGDIKETELVVDWTKLIPRSVSKPHGMQLPKYFTDVGWLGINASGTERLLDYRLKEDRVSGGHFNERKNPDTEYSFVNLVKRVGGNSKPNGDPSEWITTRIIPEKEVATQEQALDGSKQTTVVGGGLAGFLKAGAAGK